MAQEKPIALIHATRVAIGPIEGAAPIKIGPKTETVSILEESLSIDRAKSEALTVDLKDRIVRLALGLDILAKYRLFAATVQADFDPGKSAHSRNTRLVQVAQVSRSSSSMAAASASPLEMWR